MSKRLTRSNDNVVIGGVCSGLAEYLEIDPSIIRLITVILFLSGMGILPYIICWAVIPKKQL
jgi:phage shock protein C